MTADNALIPTLHNIATRLRIESIRSTTAAGSGHPSTCCSAADIVATLFFAEMRFDPKRPQDPDNDRFVLSKGTPRRACRSWTWRPARSARACARPSASR